MLLPRWIKLFDSAPESGFFSVHIGAWYIEYCWYYCSIKSYYTIADESHVFIRKVRHVFPHIYKDIIQFSIDLVFQFLMQFLVITDVGNHVHHFFVDVVLNIFLILLGKICKAELTYGWELFLVWLGKFTAEHIYAVILLCTLCAICIKSPAGVFIKREAVFYILRLFSVCSDKMNDNICSYSGKWYKCKQ